MSLKHLILAIVSQTPSSGYEIAKEFDAVSGFFWSATHQQIYRELATLNEGGLVRFREIEQTGKPDKKVYSITAKGKKAFIDWFAEPLKAPRPADPLFIKIFAGELGGLPELRAQMAQARDMHKQRLSALEAIERQHYPEQVSEMPRWKKLVYVTLRHGIARERSWLAWADESAEILAKA